VANSRGPSVTVYPAGASSPALTISSGLAQPVDVTTDNVGNVYVADRGNPPSIVAYPPAQTTPSQVFTSPLIQVPAQIFLDAAGDLYFSDCTTGVGEIPAVSNKRSL
jgi:hypothetical protein